MVTNIAIMGALGGTRMTENSRKPSWYLISAITSPRLKITRFASGYKSLFSLLNPLVCNRPKLEAPVLAS